ncbi:MAG: hypothetical protein JSR44_07335 [Spirochaetes bacterium]|nr:hypothetical protein [Spirochaetota bacterium]
MTTKLALTSFMRGIMYSEPKNKAAFLYLLIGLGSFFGCSTLNPWVDRKSDISFEKAKRLQIDVTSKDSLIKEFGEPYIIGLKNGNEVLIFVGNTNGQNSTLEVRLNERGMVKEYTFYEENPKKAPK